MVLVSLWGGLAGLAGNGSLEIRNGYLWDPVKGEYFIGRGIAYQSWNPPVGANQSFEQFDYDLLEFKKMYANSIRCEITWGEIEVADNVYDWRKPDHLIQKAEELGFKLFILVGYQYPPAWFPKEWRNVNDTFTTSNDPALAHTNALSDVINYEHPQAREKYKEHIATVVGRYRNSRAVGAWIIGNEYAYFDLWEDPKKYEVHRFIGYDPISQESFRHFLRAGYATNIARLNANWGTTYRDFESIEMPRPYPSDRKGPAFHDLIQWRKKSIGDFVALGAVAARAADPNHLQTYSMVGGIFNGRDANHTCEDGRAIVASCREAGAPLDFWSINNYANASIGNELRSADFGVGKYQAETGLPVMVSETGHSSTEDLYDKPNAGLRQPRALPGQIWESLVSGVIATHIFHWNDRNQFTEDYFIRERGFGITDQDRTPKQPVYDNVAAMFRRMADIRIENLLGGSINPPPDIYMLWSTNSDMVWPRANQEIAMTWGALKRIGYQPAILDDRGLAERHYTNATALMLSRTYQLMPEQLDMLDTEVLGSGIHVAANADLPGQYNPYHQVNPNWRTRMASMFGIDVAAAFPGMDAIVTNDNYQRIVISGARTLGPVLRAGYSARPKTWKIYHGVKTTTGTTILNHSGFEGKAPNTPALVIKTNTAGRGRSAILTFALADTFLDNDEPHEPLWDVRYDIFRAIYHTHFGVRPIIELSGPGASYVIPDYRICRNGSVLLALLNEYTNHATVTITAPRLLPGKVVENLTGGGILSANAGESVTLPIEGDGYVLLYLYDRRDGVDTSLVNARPEKVWIERSPLAVWAGEDAVEVAVGTDVPVAGASLSLELVAEDQPWHPLATVSHAQPLPAGRALTPLRIEVPDANLAAGLWRSSPDGGRWAWRAVVRTAGGSAAATVPVRLCWPIRPLISAADVRPGTRIQVPVEWQELPSFKILSRPPLDRVRLWDSLRIGEEYFRGELRLLSGGAVVARADFVTDVASGRADLTIDVPSAASGPFQWAADMTWHTNAVSIDIEDGFEGRDRGSLTKLWEKNPQARSMLLPWTTYHYPLRRDGGAQEWWDEGVELIGAQGSQSAFVIVTNPPPPLGYSGFGMLQTFAVPWALPVDPALWGQYRFGFDFKVRGGHAATIEVQVKNDDSQDGSQHLLRFQKPYVPDAARGGWDRVEATLDQFERPFFSPSFDPTRISSIVVNVQMLATNVVYFASFDDIRLDGPEEVVGSGVRFAGYESSNDSVDPEPPTLRVSRQGAHAVIEWNGGVLEQAEAVDGPWTDASDATSPLRVEPAAGAKRYYRLRSGW